jgi:hypothetical protein
LTAGRMTDGGVMHQLGRSQLAGRLPSLVHNSESGIRAGVRENACPERQSADCLWQSV